MTQVIIDMDLAKCEKFVLFIISEIDRKLRPNRIDDNALIQLTIEINKLKESVQESDLPKNIKSSIESIETKYSIKKVERTSKLTFAFILTFGAWYFIYELREQSKRKIYLQELRNKSNKILYQLKTT